MATRCFIATPLGNRLLTGGKRRSYSDDCKRASDQSRRPRKTSLPFPIGAPLASLYHALRKRARKTVMPMKTIDSCEDLSLIGRHNGEVLKSGVVWAQ